jgi:hypothetical protein
MPKLPTGFGAPPDEYRPHVLPLAMVLVKFKPMLLLLLPDAVMVPGLLAKTWRAEAGDVVPIPTLPAVEIANAGDMKSLSLALPLPIANVLLL